MIRGLVTILFVLASVSAFARDERLPKLPTWTAIDANEPKPKGARFDRKQAINIATASLSKHKPDFKNYSPRVVMYSPDTKSWFVGFDRVGDKVIGSDIGIEVRESNRSTRIIPGQ